MNFLIRQSASRFLNSWYEQAKHPYLSQKTNVSEQVNDIYQCLSYVVYSYFTDHNVCNAESWH